MKLSLLLLIIISVPSVLAVSDTQGQPIGITQGTQPAATSQQSVTLLKCTFTVDNACQPSCQHLSETAWIDCMNSCSTRRDAEINSYVACLDQKSSSLGSTVLAKSKEFGDQACPHIWDNDPCLTACDTLIAREDFSSDAFFNCRKDCFTKEGISHDEYQFCYELKLIEASELAKQGVEPWTLTEVRDIGKIGAMKGAVEIKQLDGTWKQVTLDTVVKLNDIIRTGENGRAQILLKDETAFTLGSDTELVLNAFVYDPIAPGTYGLFLEFIRGTYRLVTGKIAEKQPDKVKVKIPSGSLGTRGTDYIASYDQETRMASIHVNEGIVTFTPDATNKTEEIFAGQSAVFSGANRISSVPLTPSTWESLVKNITPKSVIPKTVIIIIGTAILGLALILFEVIRGLLKRRRKTKVF